MFLRQFAELWWPCALADVWIGFPGVWEVGRIDGRDFGCCERVQTYAPGEGGQHVGNVRNGKVVDESVSMLVVYHTSLYSAILKWTVHSA